MILIGTPHTKNAGYYRSGGPTGQREADIRTCPHCQAVIKMQEWAKAPVQNFCIKCMAPACNHESCFECIPFIRKIELFADAVVKYQQYLKVAGLEPTPQLKLILP